VIGGDFTVDENHYVLLGSTVIGQSPESLGTSELIVAFNANATKAVVRQLIGAIALKTVNGSAGLRQVGFTVIEGDGGPGREVFKSVNVL
jgi:hypothetical protein